MSYLIKNTSAEIKGVDLATRTVEGYFNVFNIADSDNDIVKQGAFSKTIAENGPSGKNRIMHLLQHDTWRPLGKPKELREDEKGLFFVTEISETTWGKDTLKLYDDGVLTEHSIGFNIIKSHWSDEDEANILTELRLWEGSTVTWGANEFAQLTSAKSLTQKEVDSLLDKYSKLQKAYHGGDYTDETFHIIEAQKNHIESQIKKALQKQEVKQEPIVEITPQDRAAEIDSIFKSFQRQTQIEEFFHGRTNQNY